MQRNQLNFRKESMSIGTLAYTLLKSGAAFEGLQLALKTAIPSLAASVLSLKILEAAIEAGSLLALIAFVERILLLLKTRKLRGHWIYKSSSGNWGHVRLNVKGTTLRYAVDLYLSKADLLKGVKEHIPGPRLGHGFDELTVYTGEVLYIWYRVPGMLYEGVNYPERHGLLTLSPTIDPNSYSAQWERTGSISSPGSSSPTILSAADQVSTADRGSAVGNFFFFIREKVFFKHINNFN
jgi:hypothetical protein